MIMVWDLALKNTVGASILVNISAPFNKPLICKVLNVDGNFHSENVDLEDNVLLFWVCLILFNCFHVFNISNAALISLLSNGGVLFRYGILLIQIQILHNNNDTDIIDNIHKIFIHIHDDIVLQNEIIEIPMLKSFIKSTFNQLI